jgi:SAM-dependent methyltransferase
VADTARLPYADGFFDFVYGNGILHHVDVDAAAREVRRVLKPGGRALFIEPLPYNPVINVYRRMARGVRTEDERPLRVSELKRIGRAFASASREEFWLFSLVVFLHFFFVRRWHPSKVRYWKKIIEEGPAYAGWMKRLEGLDRSAMRVFPPLRLLCWNTVLIVRK